MQTVEDFIFVFSEAVKIAKIQAAAIKQLGDYPKHDLIYMKAEQIEQVILWISEHVESTIALDGHLIFVLQMMTKDIESSVEELQESLKFISDLYNQHLIQQVKQCQLQQAILLTFRG